jgi:cytochrome c oxidase subunit 3
MCVAAPQTNVYVKMRDYTKLRVEKLIFRISGKDRGDVEAGNLAFGLTLALAFLFTLFQAYEYFEAPFSILDGVYGSTFFLMTGFHGVHVIVGTLFLTVCAIRNYLGHFSTTHHIGFEAAV